MTHITEHKRIHLIGIGGCSMSGLASILKNRGYTFRVRTGRNPRLPKD